MAQDDQTTQEKLREAKKQAALDGMRAHGTKTAAARAAGVGLSTLSAWYANEDDDSFKKALDMAEQEFVDDAVQELHKRAVTGDEQLVFFKGMPIPKRNPETGDPELDEDFEPVYYTRNVKSDRLLEVLLKSKRPEYREKYDLALMGPDGGAVKTDTRIEIVVVDPTAKKDEPEED